MPDDKDLLVDYQPLEYDKEVIKESIDKDDGPLVVEGTLQRADAKNQNGRVYPKDVLKEEAERYMKEKVNKNNALGELDHPDCVRKSADILTSEGWKSVEDVNDDEEVYTLNPDTGEVELQQITKRVDEPYDGKMIRVKGRNIDTLVTPNHRFYLIDRYGEGYFTTAQDLHDNPGKHSHSYIPNTGVNGWKGTENSPNGTVEIDGVDRDGLSSRIKAILSERYTEPLQIDSKVWFKFLGIFLADGSSRTGDTGYAVNITQKKEDEKEEIRELLSEMPDEITVNERVREDGKATFTFNDARVYKELKHLGDCYSKRVPEKYKKAKGSHLNQLYEWYRKGDGRDVDFNGYNRKEVFSTSEDMIDDFQEVLMKIGKSGNKTKNVTEEDYTFADRTIKAENKEPLHVLHESTTKGIYTDPRHLTVEEVHDFDDRVYCVSVPNETIYLRDQGKVFWSGNSSVVNLKNVSHNVIDMEWDGNDLNGKIEILNTPSGEILQDLLEAGIRLGISSRGLGSVSKRRDGAVEVQDDFELVGFDFVSNPSTHGAFMEPINEAVDKKRVEEAQKWHSVDRMAQEIVGELSEKYSG